MLYHEPTKSLLLKVPDPLRIRELLPSKSKTLAHPDYNLAVQHTMETVKVLRNIGLEVPATIQQQYRWPGKYKPFDHQRLMAEFMTMHKRCFNLSEMGTGKTASALWAADHLMELGIIDKALILTPLSTMERVWMKDIFDVLMHRRGIKVHGTREQRLAALNTDVDFYILNHDGVKIPPVAEAIRRNPDIKLVIIDEGSMFRNAESEKVKALIKMLRDDMWVWWLTGTPCPNWPTDAWAQTRIVSPNRVPKFFGAFKRATMLNVSQFKWVPKPDAYNIAYEAMQPAVRFKKSECLDLPPVTNIELQSTMTKEQRAAFTAMKSQMAAELKSGAQITAVNAADKVNKIRQILCGSVKIDDDRYDTIPHGPRVETLYEAIQMASAKVYVVVPFKGIVYALADELRTRKLKGDKPLTVEIVNGDVPARKRDMIFKNFKEQPDPHVLLCHPKVMAHGLNLTEADMLVFYAPIFSNDEFRQVTERMNRAGQTRKMTIVRMGIHPIEWEIYRAIDSRNLTQDTILSLYKHITE